MLQNVYIMLQNIHIMLQNIQDAAGNETSHPKSVHVYLLSHRNIPAIQSDKYIIPTGHPQHTVKPHFHPSLYP